MFPQGLKKTNRQFVLRLFALARSAFVEMFGGQDHHHNSGPVSDRVAKERANVPFLVAHAVEHNPNQQNATGHNGKTMAFKKRLVLCFTKRKFQIATSTPTLK